MTEESKYEAILSRNSENTNQLPFGLQTKRIVLSTAELKQRDDCSEHRRSLIWENFNVVK